MMTILVKNKKFPTPFYSNLKVGIIKIIAVLGWYVALMVTDDAGQPIGPKGRKVIGDKLQRPHYLSRIDRSRRQRTDIGKYSFVNRTIQDWNQLPAEVLGTLPCKLKTLKKRVSVRKIIEKYSERM